MKRVTFITALAVYLFATLPMSAVAESTNIRFYELHKRDGEKRLRVKKTDQAGCHNFRREVELHRIGMIGYAWCSVYSEKNCAQGTEVPALWTGKRYRLADFDLAEPQIRILRGAKWVFTDKQSVLDNDARRYHDKTRTKARKERLKALQALRQDIESGVLPPEDIFTKAEPQKKADVSTHRFGSKKSVFAKSAPKPKPMSRDARLANLEKLEAEIKALEKDYDKDFQRNAMAASWRCELK